MTDVVQELGSAGKRTRTTSVLKLLLLLFPVGNIHSRDFKTHEHTPRTHMKPESSRSHRDEPRTEPTVRRTGRTAALKRQFSGRSPEREHDITSSKLPRNKEPGAASGEPDQHRNRSGGRGKAGPEITVSSRTGTDCGATAAPCASQQAGNTVRTRKSRFGGAAHLRPEEKSFTRSGSVDPRSRTAESGPGRDGAERRGGALLLSECLDGLLTEHFSRHVNAAD
ncbi:hypothetical protein CRENBAI_007007 [Crenichthys baileyi]|uniref:Uncharacterized protein n=1 Tax=Crenichthys baileyi TaxID=28760 RepID=A0AAV9RTM8_9TELE